MKPLQCIELGGCTTHIQMTNNVQTRACLSESDNEWVWVKCVLMYQDVCVWERERERERERDCVCVRVWCVRACTREWVSVRLVDLTVIPCLCWKRESVWHRSTAEWFSLFLVQVIFTLPLCPCAGREFPAGASWDLALPLVSASCRAAPHAANWHVFYFIKHIHTQTNIHTRMPHTNITE